MTPYRSEHEPKRAAGVPFPRASIWRQIVCVWSGRLRELEIRRWRVQALVQAREHYKQRLVVYYQRLDLWLAEDPERRHPMPPPVPLPQHLPWDPDWLSREIDPRLLRHRREP